MNSNEPIAVISFQLSDLKDQIKRIDWYDLQGRNGNPGGRVHLVVHYIWSKVRFLEDLIKKSAENIEINNEDLSDFQKDLATLYEAFPDYAYKFGNSNDKSINRSVIMETEIKKALPRSSSGPIQQLDKILLLLTAMILFFSVFVCFARDKFFDVKIN